MKTERIYDQDSHTAQCMAMVTACRAHGEDYQIALDRTCFFPEGGGQYGDRGELRTGDGTVYTVTDTQEEGDVVCRTEDNQTGQVKDLHKRGVIQ